MEPDRHDSDNWGRGGQGRGWDELRRGPSRGRIDRGGDEIRSWSGDEQGEHRRSMDKSRGYGMVGFEQAEARYLDDRGP